MRGGGPRMKNLQNTGAVQYAIGVKPADQVLINGSEVAKDLLKALYIEVLKAGGYPTIITELNGILAAKYKYANDNQLKYLSPLHEVVYRQFQGYINVIIYYIFK